MIRRTYIYAICLSVVILYANLSAASADEPLSADVHGMTLIHLAQNSSDKEGVVSADELKEFYAPKNIKTRGIGGVRQGRTSGQSTSNTVRNSPGNMSRSMSRSATGYAYENTEARKQFQNILFDVNSYRIKGNSYSQLDEIGKAIRTVMNEYPGSVFVIEGHTDSVGNQEHNKMLSYKRAEEVRNYIVSRFEIDWNSIKIVGYGEERPVAPNDTEASRSRNRRVEIVRR